MEYAKFIKDLKFTKDEKAKREMVKKHITTDYVPYVSKVDLCKRIVKYSNEVITENRELKVKDTPVQYLLFIMNLIKLYTDIEFTNEQNHEAYDALNQAGVFEILFSPTSDSDSLISQKEYKEFQTILNMCNDDYYENYRSLGSILESKLEAINMMTNVVSEAFKEVAENGESISVLQS